MAGFGVSPMSVLPTFIDVQWHSIHCDLNGIYPRPAQTHLDEGNLLDSTVTMLEE